MVVRLALIGLVAIGLLQPVPLARAQAVAATLSVLGGEVQRVPANGGQPIPGIDGDDLDVGDRVLTGPGATALVTFLDGNTLTVQPESDITLQRADVNTSGGSIVNIKINVGTVWARVSGLVDQNAGFTLESNTATATVRDGKQGGQQNPDGSFQCWILGGEMTVASKAGGAPVVLKEGETTVVRGDQMAPVRQIMVNQSSLRITTGDGILPLMLQPDGARLAGFVAPGVEVNQVFGARTQLAEQGRLIEVPAGLGGPYRLILEGQQEGPFQLLVTGLFQGQQVFQRELSGTLKMGERLATDITLEHDPATTASVRTAKVVGGTAAPLQPFTGPLPGKIVLAPGAGQ